MILSTFVIPEQQFNPLLGFCDSFENQDVKYFLVCRVNILNNEDLTVHGKDDEDSLAIPCDPYTGGWDVPQSV